MSDRAKLVKLADKISNLRDIVDHPPKDWDIARKQKYFDLGAELVSELSPVSPELEAVFEGVFAKRPG